MKSRDAELRRQLLGKTTKRKREDSPDLSRCKNSSSISRSLPAPKVRPPADSEEDEEDVGRSAVGRSRRPQAKNQGGGMDDERTNNQQHQERNGMLLMDKKSEGTTRTRQESNFLDHILSERAQKPAKKKKRKRNRGAATKVDQS